jgi:hypothetical protein
MSAASDPPIIITGGSVTIEFDPKTFGGDGKYTNPQKVIKRVEITGDGIKNYDSTATGNNITVKIIYDNP